MIKFKQKDYSIIGDVIEWNKDKVQKTKKLAKKGIKAVGTFKKRQLDRSMNLDPEALDTISSNELDEMGYPMLASDYIRYRKTPISELALTQPVVSAGIPLGYAFAGPIPGTSIMSVAAQGGVNALGDKIGKKISKDPEFDFVKKSIKLVRKGKHGVARNVLSPLAGGLGFKGAKQYWDDVAEGKYDDGKGLNLQKIVEKNPKLTEKALNVIGSATDAVTGDLPLHSNTGTEFMKVMNYVNSKKK